MQSLNFPSYDYKVTKKDGKVYIWDVIRKQHVKLTPEEWVRQHAIHFLISHLQYPAALMSVETGLRYNSLAKRSDIVIHDRSGKPWMVVECKSFEVPVDGRAAQQVSIYNQTIQAPYVVITNGINHYCWVISDGEITVLNSFPEFPA